MVLLCTGVVLGTWAARLPVIKAELGLSDAELSVALITLEGGAFLGLPLGGRLVARHGSPATLRWALPLFAVALTGLAVVPTLPVLAAGTAFFATALAYAGSFVAPAVIGTVATATNLTVALPPPAALVVVLVPYDGQMARSRSAQ